MTKLHPHRERQADTPAISDNARRERIQEFTRWETLASCIGTNPEIFHVLKAESRSDPEPQAAYRREVEVARGICKGCDVREACLEFGVVTYRSELDDQPTDEILGGLTERELRELHARWIRGEWSPVTNSGKKTAAAVNEGIFSR